MSIASPLPHPTTPLLIELAVLSLSWPLRAGPAGRLTPLRAPGPAAGPPLRGQGHGGHAVCFSPSSSFLGHALVPLLMARLHKHGPPACSLRITSPSGDMPGHGSAVTWQISGHVPLLTMAVTVPRYLTWHVPWVMSPSPPHVPLITPPPIANLNPCTRCTVLTGERGSLEPHGAKLEARS